MLCVCRWSDWEGMQAALRDASGKAEVGILLDYSRATLSVYLNGERLVTPNANELKFRCCSWLHS